LVSQQSVSHVRVVRLSYLSGTVAVKGPGATEWAKAILNTPVQEGFEVSTAADSIAEVEFENGSTARLGQLSHLAFNQLALDPEGHKLNRMRFEQGYATFHFLPEKHDSYCVKIAGETLTPSGKSTFRTDLSKGHVRVEVFNGSVQIVGPSGSAKLGKDKILEYNTGTTEVAFNTKRGIVKDSWDKWTETRDSQLSLALKDQAVAAHRPAFGWSKPHDAPVGSTVRALDSSMAFPRP
jgi:ferric-dicitrate binding protein FerR (iron transport regulator)